MRAAVKSLLLVACAGLVLALGTAAPASAATPCWKALINDWFDGTIDKTYPRALLHGRRSSTCRRTSTCTRARRTTSSARCSPRSARTATAASRRPTTPEPTDAGAPQRTREPATTRARSSSKGVILRAIEWLGPSDAASVPLPLLILAGVAFLLLAAAGGSFVNRRLQERRLPPPPQA